jgi:3-hydroxyisobutyrate dehydrogenase-like beta-hydroxyacid dehydrogenase
VLTNVSFAAALEGMLLAKAMGLPQELYEEGGQATTMLNALHLQYLSPYKMPAEAVRGKDFQNYLRGRMEIAQKDLGLALQMAHDHGIAMPVTGLVTQVLAKVYGVYDDALR